MDEHDRAIVRFHLRHGEQAIHDSVRFVRVVRMMLVDVSDDHLSQLSAGGTH
jgi:hypothetical protein